jgi:hypothetical protein
MTRLLLVVSGASLLAAALVLVWIVTHDDAETESPAELSHVHGMGVNPADGLLYIAAHDGLFVLDEGGAVDLVGEGRQDMMGFTVAGARRSAAVRPRRQPFEPGFHHGHRPGGAGAVTGRRSDLGAGPGGADGLPPLVEQRTAAGRRPERRST